MARLKNVPEGKGDEQESHTSRDSSRSRSPSPAKSKSSKASSPDRDTLTLFNSPPIKSKSDMPEDSVVISDDEEEVTILKRRNLELVAKLAKLAGRERPLKERLGEKCDESPKIPKVIRRPEVTNKETLKSQGRVTNTVKPSPIKAPPKSRSIKLKKDNVSLPKRLTKVTLHKLEEEYLLKKSQLELDKARHLKDVRKFELEQSEARSLGEVTKIHGLNLLPPPVAGEDMVISQPEFDKIPEVVSPYVPTPLPVKLLKVLSCIL
jgi:hypothetical protein